MEKIEIREALHGWIIAYWIGTRHVEEVYIYARALADRIEELACEMCSC